MAFVTIPNGLLTPTPVSIGSSTPAFSALSLLTATGATDYAVWIVRVPKAGTLATVGFRTGTVTTPADLRVSFQDVTTATGLPDGSVDQFCDVASGSVTANTWLTTGNVTHDGSSGGTKRTVSQGDLLAVVVKFASGAGNLQIVDVSLDETWNFPFSLTLGGTKRPRANTLFLTYDDGSYARFVGAVYPWSGFTAQSVATNTTPDEVGNRISLPFTCKVNGCWIKTNVTGSFEMVLYDTDGTTVLAQSGTQTTGLRQAANPLPSAIPFTSEVELDAGSVYRLVLKPTTTTTLLAYNFDVPVAAAMGAIELGTDCYSTSRTDAGAWTDVNTKRYFMGLRVSQVDTGSPVGSGDVAIAFIG
jgi:hypothetical protein